MMGIRSTELSALSPIFLLCATAPALAVSGALYGATASHARIVYRINSSLVPEVTGAGVFKR
jgi:hypothetical protein